MEQKLTQPLAVNPEGVVRFVENRAVRMLLNHAQNTGFGLNQLAVKLAMEQVSPQEMAQLAQLIGYSVCGFNELSYVSDDLAGNANREAEKLVKGSSGCRATGCSIHSGVKYE